MTDDTGFAADLRRAQAGEPAAFGRLYDALQRRVLAYMRLAGVSEPDDLTSEVFLQAFRNLDRFDGDQDGFRAWVFTIARRRVQDDRRQQARRPAFVALDHRDDVVGGDVVDDAERATAGDRAVAMLATLTGEQREVMVLRVIADLPLEDVARVTGRSVNAVKSLQHRATAALRRDLRSHPQPEALPERSCG